MAKGIRGQRSSPSAAWTIIMMLMLAMSLSLLLLMALRPFSSPTHGAVLSLRFPAISVKQHVIRNMDKEIVGRPWVEVISWEPRAFIYHDFLSKEECEYLISLGKPHMKKSSVIDSTTGKSKDSRVRTSSGAFLRRGQDKIIRAIEKRIADFTFIPEEHGEGLQILHYEVGQKYEPHYDYFLDQFNSQNGGQRLATVLMYLSEVEAGGETVFPNANINDSLIVNQNGLSECGKTGLSVKPRLGDALLFWSMTPEAGLDPKSLHGGCPVISGNKWSATKWLHVNEFKM